MEELLKKSFSETPQPNPLTLKKSMKISERGISEDIRKFLKGSQKTFKKKFLGKPLVVFLIKINRN